ncbi:hypothetical protein PSYJYH_000029 [Bacillus phage PSYJ-YH]|nr:hypothetical protein PSYJYH_000029 [Bacillus phage PSYJ-YH]
MAVTKGFDFSNTDSVRNAESNEKEEHFYRFVKAGDNISVGLLAPSEYAQVDVYDVYPITQTVGIPEEDLFNKAKQEMMRLSDIEKATSMGLEPNEEGIKQATENYKNMSPQEKESYKNGAGKEWHNLIKEAYRLDKQVRFLFGFYDFETGSPFVIQTTKKQAENIYKKIAEAWVTPEGGQAPAEMFAYKITKGTGGFALDVDTTKMLMTMPPEVQEKHRELRSQVISEDQFSTAHFVLSVEAQKDAIKEFASHHSDFNLESVISGVESKETTSQSDSNQSNNGNQLDIQDDDLPF